MSASSWSTPVVEAVSRTASECVWRLCRTGETARTVVHNLAWRLCHAPGGSERSCEGRDVLRGTTTERRQTRRQPLPLVAPLSHTASWPGGATHGPLGCSSSVHLGCLSTPRRAAGPATDPRGLCTPAAQVQPPAGGKQLGASEAVCSHRPRLCTCCCPDGDTQTRCCSQYPGCVPHCAARLYRFSC